MNEQDNLPSNIDIINVLKNSNLTPSQKVSVITEINNKNQPSKNLSHVPCKFFRQGACQAGNSCPFSHTIDLSNDIQPCKYFQKGNCKFGVKCALAHVMPDGKKINTSKLSQASFSCHNLSPNNKFQNKSQNQFQFQNNSNFNNSKIYSNDSSPSDILNTVEPININNYYNQNNNSNNLSNQNQFIINNHVQQLNYNNYQYSNQFIPSDNSIKSSSNSQTIYQNTAMATSPFNNMSIWSNNSYSESSNHTNNQFIRSLSFPNNNINNNISNSNMNSIPSISNSSFNQSFTSPSQLIFSPPISSSNNQTFSTIVDSAILDSETEGTENENEDENENENENEKEKEKENEKIIGNLSEDIDYIPSVLNDLLTPQEVKRRNSRSSFTSQDIGFSMSKIKDVYNLIEEDTPFVMD